MAEAVGRYVADIVVWAFCILAVVILHALGVIDDPAYALAGAALWYAIRAYSKADVNTARKSENEAS